MKKSSASPSRCWKKAKRIPNLIPIALIKGYRFVFSPSVGALRSLPFYPRPSCIFYPTCSQYAVECFKRYGFFTALRKSVSRIARCHPGNDPAVDMP